MSRSQLGLALRLVVLALGLAGLLAWRGAHRPVPVGEVPVVSVDVAQVRTIASPGRWTLRRVDDGWRVTAEGLDAPADDAAVGRLLGALGQAHHGLRVDGPDATYGLDAPVTLVVEGHGPPIRVEVGAPAAVGGRSYVRIPAGGVAAVRAPLAELARAPASTWVDDQETPQDGDPAAEGSGRR